MSSMSHYRLAPCLPSHQRHSWKIVRKNKYGEISKMECVNCNQEITGTRQCESRRLSDGLHGDVKNQEYR